MKPVRYSKLAPRAAGGQRLVLACAGITAALIASASFATGSHHTVVAAEAIQWGAAPPSLPPGAQAAALLGSPSREGPFVLRLRFPAGYVVPPHRHSKDEFVTVMSGRFQIASGETVDRASLHSLEPASFVHLPAGMPHYARADGETVVQINGVGPFDVVYVDPKDDPRRQ